MNDLCVDIGYRSLNHVGEELCGDHVEVVEQEGEDSFVVVLADGLGSGVKAGILSTLTARIISTMMAAGLSIEDCVETIAATLPVCSVRNVAYSTFTIMRIIGNKEAEIIQYDNPAVIMLRDGVNFEYPRAEMTIGGKKIFKSKIDLQEHDVFIAMSDGCIHAGVGMSLNFGWDRKEIADFMETLVPVGYTAKALASLLLDACDNLYGHRPGDDTTVCALRVRRREHMNMLFGPPAQREDCGKMMEQFFGMGGKRIVCGGTTSSIAAEHLGTEVRPTLDFFDPEIPPTAEIDGVDLCTEGVITVSRVLEYAKDCLGDNKLYEKWSLGKDGASRIAQLLFEEATDINFVVGRAINPAHQNPDLPINFHIKMNLVKELSECLRRMGKKINVTYF